MMRSKMLKRMLEASGGEGFSATEQQSMFVRVSVLNDTPHERIAECLNISLAELRINFARDLDLAKDEILAVAALNILELAAQREDLGVAFRANELLLKPRLGVWREPKQKTADTATNRLEDLSNEDLEDIIRKARTEADGSVH